MPKYLRQTLTLREDEFIKSSACASRVAEERRTKVQVGSLLRIPVRCNTQRNPSKQARLGPARERERDKKKRE